MPLSHSRRAIGPLLALAFGLAAGCGGEPKVDESRMFTAKGKLVDGNRPWVLDESKLKLPSGVNPEPQAAGMPGGAVRMALIPAEGGDVYYAKLDTTTGVFEVPRINPGRYKVTLTGGSTVPGGPGDPFGGKFNSTNTKIVRDIEDGKEIVIDVSKPTG